MRHRSRTLEDWKEPAREQPLRDLLPRCGDRPAGPGHRHRPAEAEADGPGGHRRRRAPLDGKVKLHQAVSTTGIGAASGALWGGVIGLLFFMPFLGAAVGGATGAAVGAATDTGVDDNFMRQVGQKMEPGSAALFMLVRSATADKVVPQFAQYGGEILQTSLSADQEEHLVEALKAAKAPSGV
ncbi:DUF1269 domain-containing protein [Kitasatospora arboriphila]